VFGSLKQIFKPVSKIWSSGKHPMSCLDLRGQSLPPEELLAALDAQAAVVDVMVSECVSRHLLAFSLDPAGSHPMIMTACEIVNAKIGDHAVSNLKRWFDRVQPQYAKDVLGLSLPATHILSQMQACCAELPWRRASGIEVALSRAGRNIKHQTVNNKPNTDCPPSFSLFGGPVGEEAIARQFQRLTQLANSIQENGYTPDAHENFITAEVLVNDRDELRFLIGGGQHRTSVLPVLGITRFPVFLKQGRILRRASVATWPAVEAGQLSQEQALSVFDRVFNAQQPDFVKAVWPP